MAPSSRRSDLEWMAVRAPLLFRHDARGHLLETNAPDASPAPDFYLARSHHGNLWRFGAQLSGDGHSASATKAGLTRLARLASRELPLSGAPPWHPPERAPSFEAVLTELGRAPHWVHRGPVFRFPDPALEAPDESVGLRSLGFEDAGRLPPGWGDLAPAHLPLWAVLEGGRVVSQCHSSRSDDGAAEAGVETQASHRGRGLALLVTRAWAAAVRAEGRVPFYSCVWENAASLSVARRLGLEPLGEDLHYRAADQ